jgi:hypothetical protein
MYGKGQYLVTKNLSVRGEILSHPQSSVPQTIVLRYQEIGGILCTKQRSNGIVSI